MRTPRAGSHGSGVHIAVNIIMLKAAAPPTRANRLLPNELQDVPFGKPKRHVPAGETGHIAVPNRPFCGAPRHKPHIIKPWAAF